MIRVVLADDHKIFRQGVASLLKSDENIDVIGEVGSCREAYDLICDEAPDVAIVDLIMPDGSGLKVLKDVKKAGLKTKIIILTMQNDGVTAIQASKLGVDGYLLKDGAFEELRNVIETVLTGKSYVCPAISAEIEAYEANVSTESSDLTRREKEILRLITRGQTNREIGVDLCISIKTVETHRTNIMKKLDIHKTADLVRYAIESGLDREADF